MADPKDQGCQRARGECRAPEVEPLAAGGSARRHHALDRHQHQCDQRRVDEKDGPPADQLSEQAACEYPGGRTAGGRGLPEAKRAVAFRTLAVGRSQQRQRSWRDHRPGGALHDPRDDQSHRRLRQAGPQRGDREQQQPSTQEPPAADQVSGPPADQEQRSERQRITRDDPLQVGGRDRELVLDRGQRDVYTMLKSSWSTNCAAQINASAAPARCVATLAGFIARPYAIAAALIRSGDCGGCQQSSDGCARDRRLASLAF